MYDFLRLANQFGFCKLASTCESVLASSLNSISAVHSTKNVQTFCELLQIECSILLAKIHNSKEREINWGTLFLHNVL